MASDASPAAELQAAFGKHARRWQRRFDKAAPELARFFASAAKDCTDRELAAILKRAGITVEFKMTAAVQDAYSAVIGEQVGLIRSIASEHLAAVQGLVMRSVQQGRDLGPLAKEIEARYGLTRKRAALIARDQNNKATATLTKTRQQGLGLTRATCTAPGPSTPGPSMWLPAASPTTSPRACFWKASGPGPASRSTAAASRRPSYRAPNGRRRRSDV